MTTPIRPTGNPASGPAADLLLVSAKANAGYNIAPPLGLYQLRAYLGQRGVPADLLDRELNDPEPFLEATASGRYNLLGFSVSHDQMSEDLELLWKFKQAQKASGRAALVIAGGQDAALNHEQWLECGIDVCFLGFAEKPLLEFCRRVALAETFDLEALCEGIDGVAYKRRDGQRVYQPAAGLHPEEFTELFYDQIQTFDIPYHRYWDLLRSRSADTRLGASKFIIENVRLYTTSHCPRRCGFCNSQSFLPQSQGSALPITMLSADQVGNLILHMVGKYGARGFLFSDDDFPVGNKQGLARVADLCDQIREFKSQGLIDRDTTFACQARVMDFVMHDEQNHRVPNRDLMHKMVQAGFNSVGMGVETFSDKLLRAPSINKVGVTASDCRMVIEAMLEIGLVPQINLILGIPESGPEELAGSIRTALAYVEQGCDVAVTPKLLALPGAPIYGKGLYPTMDFTRPVGDTGQMTTIQDYFVPGDPKIRALAEQFDAAARKELRHIAEACGWEGKIIHKRVVSISRLLVAARLLEDRELTSLCEAALATVLELRTPRGA